MRVFYLLLFLIVTGCSTARLPAPVRASWPDEDSAAELTDHHVHLLSPRLVRDWKSLGVPFSRPDSAYTSVSVSLAEARRIVVLPMGYLYSNTDFRGALGLSHDEERARVRAENEHAAAQAARHPGRVAAFCSVNPLRPYAWEELRHCQTGLGTRGLKLHLAMSGVDLRNEGHLDTLASVVAWAARERVPVMMHLDPQVRGLEADDIRRLIHAVLQPVPELDLVIPHLGGSGGYGPWTQAVLDVFITWLDTEARAGVPRPGVRFDLSAVWLSAPSEGVPASTPEQAAQLRTDLRRLGFGRLLFGSDAPVFSPRRSAEALREALGWTDEEWHAVRANELDVFRP